jgi:hypothetical protein
MYNRLSKRDTGRKAAQIAAYIRAERAVRRTLQRRRMKPLRPAA